jgi:hypothetical protein
MPEVRLELHGGKIQQHLTVAGTGAGTLLEYFMPLDTYEPDQLRNRRNKGTFSSKQALIRKFTTLKEKFPLTGPTNGEIDDLRELFPPNKPSSA